jgi:hypothetical protein
MAKAETPCLYPILQLTLSPSSVSHHCGETHLYQRLIRTQQTSAAALFKAQFRRNLKTRRSRNWDNDEIAPRSFYRSQGSPLPPDRGPAPIGPDKFSPQKKSLNFESGEPGGTRTRDHRIKSAMLYQLSYRPAVTAKELLGRSVFPKITRASRPIVFPRSADK